MLKFIRMFVTSTFTPWVKSELFLLVWGAVFPCNEYIISQNVAINLEKLNIFKTWTQYVSTPSLFLLFKYDEMNTFRNLNQDQ